MESVAVDTTTPVTTTETPAVAPTTSAPSTESVTSQRPTSFAQAFEQVAAAQETPPTETTETAATVPSVEATPAGADPGTPKEGPIPFQVHKTALENARTKAVEDYKAQTGDTLAQVLQVPRHEIAALVQEFKSASTDPVGHAMRVLTEAMANDPNHAAKARSEIGRVFGGLRQTAKPVDLTPDVQITDAQGQVVGATFSAERVQAIVAKAVQDAISKEVSPLKTAHERQQAAVKAAETQRLVDEQTTAAITEIHDILEITDPKAEASVQLFAAVNAVMAEHPTWTAEKAARDVWKTHVRPTYERKATEKVLDTNHKKAAATTANGRGTTATPSRPKDAASLAAYLRSLDR